MTIIYVDQPTNTNTYLLHVLNGPITRSKIKALKEALNRCSVTILLHPYIYIDTQTHVVLCVPFFSPYSWSMWISLFGCSMQHDLPVVKLSIHHVFLYVPFLFGLYSFDFFYVFSLTLL